jgi:hypothetical protein
MSAMVGIVADRLTNRLNNSLSGTSVSDLRAHTRVFLRETKLTVGSACAQHGPATIEPRYACPVQQDVKKNYISILSDAPENEQAAGTAARSHPRTMKDFVGRLAAVLKSRLPGAPGPTITP